MSYDYEQSTENAAPDTGDTETTHSDVQDGKAAQTSAPAQPGTVNKNAKQKPPEPGNLRLIGIVAILVLVVVALFGIVPKIIASKQTSSDAQSQVADAGSVQYVTPTTQPAFQDLLLPGNIEAVQESSISARSTGYVSQIFANIGDKVTQGEILATIEAPDVDQELAQAHAQLSGSMANLAQSRAGEVAQEGNLAQADANLSRSIASLAQARQTLSQAKAQLAQAQEAGAQQKANLAQAQANLDLADVTNKRYQNLVAQGAIDQETADQQDANYKTNVANVEALSASLQASQANIDAYAAGVRSNDANVSAFQSGVTASRAGVATAQADVESSQAVVTASQADVESNEANVQHIAVLVGFNNIIAPFTGVITARNIDLGDLVGGGASSGASIGSNGAGVSTEVSAASGSSGIGTSSTVTSSSTGSSSTPSTSSVPGSSNSLFSEVQLRLMHIYVNVPQSASSQMYPGMSAKVMVSSIPNKVFSGTVTRTAEALDPGSRTLVTEVRVDNAQQTLRPGMFAEVSFHIPQSGGGLLVPDTAVVTNAQNTQVVVITPQNTLHFLPVTIVRDFGDSSLVQGDLQPNAKLVDNPTDSMLEGQSIKSATPEKPQPQGS